MRKPDIYRNKTDASKNASNVYKTQCFGVSKKEIVKPICLKNKSFVWYKNWWNQLSTNSCRPSTIDWLVSSAHPEQFKKIPAQKQTHKETLNVFF